MSENIKTGEIFYSSSGRTLKFKAYRLMTPKEYLKLGGRWQEMNEYGGWKNCEYTPEQDPFDRWA